VVSGTYIESAAYNPSLPPIERYLLQISVCSSYDDSRSITILISAISDLTAYGYDYDLITDILLVEKVGCPPLERREIMRDDREYRSITR